MKKGRGRATAKRQQRQRSMGPIGPVPDVRTVYFDGACGPMNPGGVATYGWRLVGPDGRTLASGRGEACRGPQATNNVAEWHALLEALRSLGGSGAREGRLQILGDSQLVINQLTGRWRCRKEHLRRYRDECLNLLEGTDWCASWIPRGQNAEADALSRRPGPK